MYKEETDNLVLKKILIVEDDIVLCHLLKKKLSGAYDIHIVYSVSAAIESVTSNPPALMCLDYSMPDGSAAELIQQLSAVHITLPFIVMTGYSDMKLAVEMMKLGAIDIIVKDENFTELINTIFEKTFRYIENELKVDRLQKALAISEVRYEQLFENAANAYLVLQNGKIIQCNKKAIELLGYTRQELVGKSPLDFKPLKQPEEQHSKIQMLNAFIEVEKGIQNIYETVYQRKDKTFFLANVTANKVVLGDTKLVVAELVDITEKKEAEKALKESEKKYRIVAEKTADVIWLMDLEGKSTFVTQSIERFTGYTVDEYLEQSITDRFTAKSAEYCVGIFSRELIFYRTRTELLTNYKMTMELEYNCKNGSTKWGELVITPLYDDENRLIGIHGVTRDITERRNMTLELKKSEEKFRNLVEASSDIIWETNEKSEYLYLSPQVNEILGYAAEELLYKTPFVTMPEMEAIRMKTISQEIISAKTPYENIENVHLHKNGHQVIFETSGIPYFNESGVLLGYRGVDRNITERKLTKEKELTHYKNIEKLSAIVFDIVESPIEYDIYKIIAEQLNEFVEGSIVIVSSYNKLANTFEVKAIKGLGNLTRKVMQILGSEIVGKVLPATEESLQALSLGKLSKINEGIYQMALNKIPKFICDSIESLLNIKEIFGIGIVQNREIQGSLIICVNTRLTVEPELIEIYANQISVILQKRHTELVLRDSEERYRELFNNANDLIYTYDLHGHFKSYNKKTSDILNLPEFDETNNLHLSDILEEAELNRALEKIKFKADKKNIFKTYELEVKSKNGIYYLLEVSSTMRYKGGKPFEIFGIARDITERRCLERSLQKTYEHQDIISSILRLSLENISLNTFLNRTLDILLSLEGLSIERQGCIFLANKNSELILAAHKNMEDISISCCKLVPFGQCCCGKAAETQQAEYSQSHSCEHDINCVGEKPHGHYCLPIIDKEKTIGVTNIYIEEAHQYNTDEKNFLSTVANTLAGIIARKQAEEKLLNSYDELEQLVQDRTKELELANDQLHRDIADRRIQEEKLRYSENLNKSTIDAISDMIAVVDNDLRIIMTNDAWQINCKRLFNCNETLSKRIESVLSFLDAKKITEIQSIFKYPYNITLEETINHNGQQLFLELKTIPVYSEKTVIRAVFLIHDVTQQKEVESEIRLNLEREKELNMLKSRFVSVVSHEFRTPLAGIQSSIQLLEKFGKKWDDEKIAKLFKGIYSSIRYANLLLEDVSLISQDDASSLRLSLTEIDIFDVCKQSIEDLKAVYSDSEIRLNITPNQIQLKTDESLLRHILNNILSNAIKYSPIESIVKFDVFVENDSLIFKIIDSGKGIPEEDIKFIFEPFHRASNVEGIKGTGLGLAIVKRCIKLLKGSIEIKSKKDEGTEVLIKLPMEKIVLK